MTDVSRPILSHLDVWRPILLMGPLDCWPLQCVSLLLFQLKDAGGCYANGLELISILNVFPFLTE
jgi:hypothetical protein